VMPILLFVFVRLSILDLASRGFGTLTYRYTIRHRFVSL
jgi:hypothetical protein